MDSTNLLTRLAGIQLEVLRRATERKEKDLKGLVVEKSNYLTHANEQLISKSLPSLPSEIIAQIFRSLYLIESRSVASAEILFDQYSQSTVWAFVNDKHTPEDWRSIIQSEVPVVVTQAQVGHELSELHLREAHTLLGTRPRTFQPQGLDNGILSSSTTVLVTAEGWPELKKGLGDLCGFPWRCLIFAHLPKAHEVLNAQLELAMVNTIFAECGHKIADLERLVILPFKISEGDDVYRVGQSAGEPSAFNILKDRAPKLRVASLPLPLLLWPGLRHYLSRVTDLKVFILPLRDFEKISVYFRPFSDTLVKLTLLEGRRDKNFPLIDGVGSPISFSRLESLSIQASDYAQWIIWNALSCINCPTLITLSRSHHQASSIGLPDRRISAIFLHTKFPLLESYNITLGNYDVRLEVFLTEAYY